VTADPALRTLLARRLGAAEADALLAMAAPGGGPGVLLRGLPIVLSPPAPAAVEDARPDGAGDGPAPGPTTAPPAPADDDVDGWIR